MSFKNETITQSISAREDEIIGYQINIDNFKHIVNQIETKYKDATVLDIIAEKDIEFAESLKHSILENEIQLSRVYYILNALKSQL